MNATLVGETSACAKLGITAAANKELMIFRYCFGHASIEETQEAFRLHPEWKHA